MTEPTLTLPVKFLRSVVAGRRPGDGTFRALMDGELFVNLVDLVMCFLTADGVLREFPVDPAALFGSPELTGTPTGPTAPLGTSSNQLSTTAFVTQAIAALITNTFGGDDEYATTIAAALANRLRVDGAQGLSAAQQTQALANLGVLASMFVPPSTVSFFATGTAPPGWLKANGATLSRSVYANLYAAIGATYGAGDGSTTFSIPDLRGVFVRGWDDGRGLDPSRAFGSYQADQLAAHVHSYLAPNAVLFVQAGQAAYASGGGQSASSGSTGGSETVPKNVALLPCIKY